MRRGRGGAIGGALAPKRRACSRSRRGPPLGAGGVGNQAVVDASDVVIICLLPVDAADALAELDFRADQAVVSAVAGLPVVQLAELVAPATDVARSIPLPAVATRDSITPVHPATSAAIELFGRLGGSLVVDDETAHESVAAASATVAAHFHYLDTIADWLAGRGIATSA